MFFHFLDDVIFCKLDSYLISRDIFYLPSSKIFSKFTVTKKEYKSELFFKSDNAIYVLVACIAFDVGS